MEQRRSEVAAHALTEAKLSHRNVEQGLQIEGRDELIPRSGVVVQWHSVYVTEQIEGLDDREVPPQLGTLAEDHADVSNVGYAVLPGNAAKDLAPAGVGDQNAGDDFDGCRLSGSVRANVTHELARLDCERYPIEGLDRSAAPAHHSLEGAPDTRHALGDVEAFYEILDDYLRHPCQPDLCRYLGEAVTQ